VWFHSEVFVSGYEASSTADAIPNVSADEHHASL
jgi:hypothetical protein